MRTIDEKRPKNQKNILNVSEWDEFCFSIACTIEIVVYSIILYSVTVQHYSYFTVESTRRHSVSTSEGVEKF